MNYKESCCDSSKTLNLIGSQVNLTPRLDKAILVSDNRKSRPCSAAPYYKRQIEHKIKCIRPKSADYTNLNPTISKSHQMVFDFNDSKVFESSSLAVSNFTNSSSKLLQNLIETSKQRVPVIEDHNFSIKNSSQAPEECKLKNKITQNEAKSRSESTVDLDDGSKLQKSFLEDNIWMKNYSSLKNSSVQSKMADVSENKTVRFLERHQLELFYEKKFSHQAKGAFYIDNKNCSSCLENEIKPLEKETHSCQNCNKSPKETKVLELDFRRTDTDDKNRIDALKSIYLDNEALKDEKESEKKMFCEQKRNSPKPDKIFEKSIESQKKDVELSASQLNIEVKNAETESKFRETFNEQKSSSGEEIDKECGKLVEPNERNENNDNQQNIEVSDSTYEEIVSLLRILDEEDSESMSSENKENASGTAIIQETAVTEKTDYLSVVSSYLEEVERDNNCLYENYSNVEKWSSPNFASPRLEELLNKNSVELAHEVISLKIQVEDQKKGIKLLRNTLAELKEEKNVEKLEHQEALQQINSEAEVLVHRHQKFIKQLLNEKKNLNETVSKLIQDLKSGEERYKRNIKAMEEKHSIEIKRAKEAQMVADKIKREKWMENKTQKIKEMTIKGLEPELSRMAVHQQEEITELRNLHKAELEALELRAARRNSELMDELRAELTKEKERAIAKEIADLRNAMTKDFEIEKSTLHQCCQNLKECIRKLEEKLSNQELEFQQRLIDYKQEEERKKQKMIRDHQENLEEVRRQHLTELRYLKESMNAEKEAFLNTYKKQQAIKSLEREAELHQQYKRERDREIELAIETLEKESAKIQSEQNAANESKLKRLKDNMEAEIREIEASEAALKMKLSELKIKLSQKEDVITELNSQIRQLQTELTFVKKTCEEMSMEKARLKEVIREEFENSLNVLVKEKENLEKEILNLKELHLKELNKKDQQNAQAKYEMQKELTRIYSRIKTAVNKKEKIIESLREENEAINQKCCHLEIMLEQQRKNLLL